MQKSTAACPSWSPWSPLLWSRPLQVHQWLYGVSKTKDYMVNIRKKGNVKGFICSWSPNTEDKRQLSDLQSLTKSKYLCRPFYEVYLLSTLFSSTCPSVNATLSTLWGNVRARTEDFIIPRVCCGQEAATPWWKERAFLASPKRSPFWLFLGGETDGAVPAPTNHPADTAFNSSPHTPPHSAIPTFTHTHWIIHVHKGLFEMQVWQMMMASRMEAA